MNNILNFMEKIYGDTKALSVIYIIGAVLLFIFILLLMFSLRKTDKTNTKDNNKNKKENKEKSEIIEEPKEDNKVVEESKIEDNKVEIKEEKADKEETIVDKKDEISNNNVDNQDIFEKTTIIPLNDEKTDPAPLSKEENIEKALDNVENMKASEEESKDIDEKISSEIPNVDDFVNDVVKKTYEKNEQFSSVYVNNETQNLDKVMDNLNVDSEVKKSLLNKSSDTPNMNLEPTIEMPSVRYEKQEENKPLEVDEVSVTEKVEEPIVSNVEPETISEIPRVEEEKKEVTSLDNLKKALDEKKKEVELKQDDLKNKLESLSKNKNN